jgi:tRNA(fMet)-specific endonuclease VapC
MFVLDTDHISLVARGGTDGQRIRARLAHLPSGAFSASIVSFEEQVRGWMAAIARMRSIERQVPFYGELERLLRYYAITPLLAFDARAVTQFQRLRQAGIRIGTMDLKIAAITLANDATLLSRNLADFGKIPGLRVEEWSV